jgi:hypothetical protein
MTRRYLSRRTFLRGSIAGTALALGLPPLDAMLRADGAWADGSQDQPFFGVFYWANGLPWHGVHGGEQGAAGHPDLWTPSTTGAGFTPPELLAPLSAHPFSVATGLEPHTAVPPAPPGQSDGHMRGFMVALTGDRPRPETFDHGSHTLTALRPSIDQYVARHDSFYTQAPRFRSLEVGVSGARFHDYGHWNAISYNGPDSLNLPIRQAGQLFDRLFDVPPSDNNAQMRARMLDAVLADANDLRAKLGASDRIRLESHLEHVATLRTRLGESGPVCEVPTRPSSTGDLLQKTETMARLLALAVSCGLTRVFSFMLTSPASTHVFSNLNVPDGMHKTCHDGHWDRVRDITRYQMQAFDRFLSAFRTPSPNGGELLDRGCILGTSEYGEGWKHSVRELPVVIAGRACGALNPGVHYREQGGNISKAHVTVLRSLGIPTPSFGFNGGETSDALTGILA